MHRESERYRQHVRRELRAYQSYVQLGCITQGLLQYLAISSTATVWHLFRSWLRTILQLAPAAKFLRRHLFQAHDQARQRFVA